MKKVENYRIPTSWDEITLKQQLEVERLAKEHPDYKTLAIIAGYCNIPMDELKALPFSTTKQILSALTFYSEPRPTDPIHEFQFKGDTYSVINHLLKQPTENFISITAVDGRPDALQYIIAILSRKKKADGNLETLDDYSIDDRAKLFGDLPISIAERIHAFFLTSAKLSRIDFNQVLDQYNQNIHVSIDSMLNTMHRSNGSGLFSRFARVILQSYLRFLKHRWSKLFYSFKLETEKQN